MVPHVCDKCSDEEIPPFECGFVGGLPWDTTKRDGIGFDNIDTNLTTTSLEEAIEMVQSQSLFVSS